MVHGVVGVGRDGERLGRQCWPRLGYDDGVYLYNPAGNLVTSVSYTSHTNGFSNQWDTNGTFLGLSAVGKYGAYQAGIGILEVGSPGYAFKCYSCSEVDIYKDGMINFKDFSVLANEWQREGPYLSGDITGNQVVDTNDLDVLSLYWLSSCE